MALARPVFEPEARTGGAHERVDLRLAIGGSGVSPNIPAGVEEAVEQDARPACCGACTLTSILAAPPFPLDRLGPETKLSS